MKSRKKMGALITVLIVIVIALYGAIKNPIQTDVYRVIRVIDGDTIEVIRDNKTQAVRLLGVDAPEKGECYFEEATTALSYLIDEEKIILSGDPLNENMDDYGRLLRYVYKDGALINEALIETGATKHLSFFPIILNDQFAETEEKARESGLGLWEKCY